MKQRIVSGFLAASGFISVLIIGDLWFAGLVFGMAMIGYIEFIKMNQFKLNQSVVWIGLIGLIYWIIPWDDLGVPMLSFESSLWVLVFILLLFTVLSKNKFNIDKVALLLIGVIYLGLGFHYLIYTRLMDNGLYWTLLILGCVWATDTGAYFTGWAIGKHKLWPSISPKKTIEGALGAIVFSLLIAILFALYQPDLLSIPHAVGLGFVISIAGQIGDFIQSAYKRARGVKDSGNILPGHGGVLDRCDSWLIVFPMIHLLSFIM